LNVEGSHTEKEWKNKKKEYNYRCAYCGIHENVLKNKYLDKKGNIQLEKSFWKLTEDHIIALSKGGSDYITNIVPACWSCNASKRNKDISKWFISKHDIPHT
jgi:5-methylcytosine-specific restriction endonuclease McrA